MSNDLKRDPIKYVRDKAKANYNKQSECFICGTRDSLDFHHFYTLTPLFNRWLDKNRLYIRNEEDILEYRDRFISEHQAELYDYTVTLCKKHHMQLHAIYGKHPPLSVAKKEMRWVNIQREKHGLAPMDS